MNIVNLFESALHGIRWSAVMVEALLFSNRDERRVHPLALPDLLAHAGTRHTSIWDDRKAALLQLFSEHVYGVAPSGNVSVHAVTESDGAFLTTFRKKEVTLSLQCGTRNIPAHLLLLLPGGEGPHPTILGYNFEGNHTVHADPSITKHPIFAKRIPGYRYVPHERTRGKRSERWPIENIVTKGYALATLYYGDIEPDYPDASSGVRAAYPGLQEREDNFSALGAWAWGLSRVMDYLTNEPLIDTSHVGLFGFSRLGKSALLAAARDERFASVIADSPGKGGAGLIRRNFGETLHVMAKKYPHWFSKKFASYAGREQELPVEAFQT